jgi:hypothetical protein
MIVFRRIVFFLIILLIPLYISSEEDIIEPQFPTLIYDDISLFYIGKDISEYNIVNNSIRIMVNSASIYPFFFVFDNGIYYIIAFNRYNIVEAIFVSERNYFNSVNANINQSFKTPDGVYLGMTYNELRNIDPDIVIKEMPGWGYYGELKSGWKVAFFIGDTMTERFPIENDIIISIYKD